MKITVKYYDKEDEVISASNESAAGSYIQCVRKALSLEFFEKNNEIIRSTFLEAVKNSPFSEVVSLGVKCHTWISKLEGNNLRKYISVCGIGNISSIYKMKNIEGKTYLGIDYLIEEIVNEMMGESETTENISMPVDEEALPAAQATTRTTAVAAAINWQYTNAVNNQENASQNLAQPAEVQLDITASASKTPHTMAFQN
jgi:hypothetical protein